MSNTTQQIRWVAGNGNEITVTLAAAYELDQQGRRRTSGLKVITESLAVNGVKEFAPRGIMTVDHPVAVAGFGSVGIKAEQYEQIKAAAAILESEIASHNAAILAEVAKADAATAANRKAEKDMAWTY